MAFCDGVVPNPFNFLYASVTGTSPLPPAVFAPGATGTFQLFTGPGFNPGAFPACSAGGVIPHGFLLNPTNAGTATATAQGDAAAFLFSGTNPPAWEKQ
jgi:hypothetical protein